MDESYTNSSGCLHLIGCIMEYFLLPIIMGFGPICLNYISTSDNKIFNKKIRFIDNIVEVFVSIIASSIFYFTRKLFSQENVILASILLFLELIITLFIFAINIKRFGGMQELKSKLLISKLSVFSALLLLVTIIIDNWQCIKHTTNNLSADLSNLIKIALCIICAICIIFLFMYCVNSSEKITRNKYVKWNIDNIETNQIPIAIEANINYYEKIPENDSEKVSIFFEKIDLLIKNDEKFEKVKEAFINEAEKAYFQKLPDSIQDKYFLHFLNIMMALKGYEYNLVENIITNIVRKNNKEYAYKSVIDFLSNNSVLINQNILNKLFEKLPTLRIKEYFTFKFKTILNPGN